MKKLFNYGGYLQFPLKLSLKMKLTVLLTIAALFQIQANTYSQNKKISLDLSNASVETVIHKIEALSEFKFLLNRKDVDLNRKVSIKVEKQEIENILSKLFSNTDVAYEILNKQIVLRKGIANLPTYPKLDMHQPSKESTQFQITGTIKDQNGTPLPGANVVEKGTTNGVTADFDGNYTIQLNNANATLIISFIGYATKEINIDGQNNFNIVLKESSAGLDEVVLIGYGSVKKSDLTGSVSSVKSEDISAFPTTDLSQALQGRASGVHVKQNSGAPGSNIQVRIRGVNSIQGSNEPLWVIDGFPADQSILNAVDIESIEILKDASATAIYGSRGANGVILVTTKRGKAGNTRVDYNSSFSLQSVRKKINLMNANEYGRYYNIFWKNTTGDEYFTQNQIDGFGKGTDWQDVIFRAAPTNIHSLDIAGGNENTKFSVGTSYFDQQGIIKNSDYQRIVLRGNINHDVSEKFSVAFNTIINMNSRNTISDAQVLLSALSAAPTVGPYFSDGSYLNLNEVYPFSPDSLINPEAYFNEVSNKNSSNYAMGNVALTYKPINGLSIKVSGNISNSNSRSDNYTGVDFPNSSGGASISVNNNIYINSTNIVAYDTTINDSHNISAIAGFTYENSKSKGLGASGSGFLSDATETYDIGSATTNGIPSSSYSEWALLSYLGRVNYSYKNKYLVTGSIRSDGSSRYSAGNKWGYFPSGAFAWRLSEEEFMKDQTVISNAKLRVGFGKTGSTAINPYYTLDMLSSGKVALEDNLYTYFAPGTRLPGNLRWETTLQTDFGIDFGFMNNRIRITADYYVKKTKDLLNTVQLPKSLGYSTTIKNVGEIQNKGMEFNVDAIVFDKSFKWDVSANLSFNKNEILKLYEGQDVQGSIYNLIVANDYVNLLREGYPISAFYGYQDIGFDDEGHYTYKDKDGDGLITEKDKSWIGDPNPDFIYGLNSSMSWNNIDLNIFIQGSQGNEIFGFSVINQNYKSYQGYNAQKDVLYNHWTPENPNANYPTIDKTFSTKMSDRFVYDGSYLRVKNIELAYNIPTSVLEQSWLTKAQISISGQNLFTITDYPWWDPEVNSSGGSNSINQGIDNYSYPTSKGFTIGAKLSF